MFKDYYLILGVGSDASPEEIEKAYKDADAKINVRGIISKDFHDIQEAFTILSKPDIRALYDKELEKYNALEDYENYKIQDAKLEDTISSLQVNISALSKIISHPSQDLVLSIISFFKICS